MCQDTLSLSLVALYSYQLYDLIYVSHIVTRSAIKNNAPMTKLVPSSCCGMLIIQGNLMHIIRVRIAVSPEEKKSF